MKHFFQKYFIKMPLQNNFKESGRRGSSEPGLSNTRPSPSPQNVPRQHSGAPGDLNGAPPQYQPTPHHAHFRMNTQNSAQLPPPPPHPDYWQSHGSVEQSSWKLVSSPLVKKAQSNMTDGEASIGNDALIQSESSQDTSLLRNTSNKYCGSAGTPNMTASSLCKAPSHHPLPFYAQGPYPFYYGMPPPPPDHAFSAPQPYPHQWQYPPIRYPIYPPTGYQVGYLPYPLPPCAHEPHTQPPPVKQSWVAVTAKKRPLPTSHNKSVHAINLPPYQQSQTKCRKRKMYSDFVGVTYNLTHAKYQACITHYRKQYYLGRYKLAVDAALAYDEAAKLLKGPNWKVNFPSKEAYEKARKEEIQRIGIVADHVIDIDQSKVAEIVASNISKLAASLGTRSKEKTIEPVDNVSTKPTSDESCGGKSKGKDGAVVRFNFVSTKKSVGKKTPFATLPATDDVDGTAKVTPCQLELEGIGISLPSSELDLKMQPSRPKPNEDEDTKCDEVRLVVKTPLSESSDPTHHAKGVENSSPESVIKPKVLQYQGHDMNQNATEVATSSRPHADSNDSASRIEQNSPVIHSGVKNTASTISAEDAAPVKKSGAFVAASALMSLHGKEED
ncbi:hypothetical protein ACHAWT_009543 [Skeletonema menzelii]